MNIVIRHLRGLLIALVALAMSAGIAFAAHPAAPGLAASHPTTTVTQSSDNEDANEVDETPEPTDTPDSTDTPDTTDQTTAGDNCTTDPTTLTPEELAALTHGSIVCWAAHQPTPDGYANHGAWVSQWAKTNHGTDASSTGKDKGTAGKAKGLSKRS